MKMKSGKEMTITSITSRYNSKHYILKLAKGIYIFEPSNNYYRVSNNVTNPVFKLPNVHEYRFIDPSGGPMIQIGNKLGMDRYMITVKYLLSVPFRNRHVTIIVSKSVEGTPVTIHSNILKLLQENAGDIQQFFNSNRF